MTPPTGTPTTPLGVPGYIFADLHDPERLDSLHERFCEEVEAADPELWHEWAVYRAAPDAPRPPITLSHLLVAMAPHVSRFVTRLFDIRPSVDALTAVTRDQDDLFRFKVDFVRRRVLPLAKGRCACRVDARRRGRRRDVDRGSGRGRGRQPGSEDLELAVARAGCALMDAEKSGGRRHLADRQPQALVRGAAARSGLSRVGHLPVSRNARLLAPRRRAAAAAGPAGVDGRPRRSAAPPRRLHADRRAHEAARSPERDPLLRALPRARQGLVLERTA